MRTDRREPKFIHALITVIFMVVVMFVSIVVFQISPHIPLVFGCMAAGLMAWYLGYLWEEILEGMIEGISNSLEAILILLLIGMLAGTWIAGGTVPAMICYGLQIVSPTVFLPAAMLICLMVAFVIGSWGTVGTMGLAFMGIGLALRIPAPLVAGTVISGAYMGEVISPLSDATNLAAAVVGRPVFSIVKRILPAALSAGILVLILYAATGVRYTLGETAAVSESITPLLESIRAQFRISPAALLPMGLMIGCILAKVSAIPSMLIGSIAGILEAMWLQGISPGAVLEYAYSGYVSETGNELIDTLLSAGGLAGMLESISIIIIAMSFGGIMKKTGQMDALVRPILARLHSEGAICAATVISCIFMNLILPDQYLGISMPGQMFAQAYEKRGLGREKLGATILGGGAVTSPLIPWNTCGIYCMTILGVSPVQYLRCAFYGIALPLIVILQGFLLKENASKKQ